MNEEHLDDIVSSTNEEYMDGGTSGAELEHGNEMSNMRLQLDRIEKKLGWLIHKTQSIFAKETIPTY